MFLIARLSLLLFAKSINAQVIIRCRLQPWLLDHDRKVCIRVYRVQAICDEQIKRYVVRCTASSST